jgi:hypothetical protein
LIALVIISNLIGSIIINQTNITPHATMLKITAEEIHFIIYQYLHESGKLTNLIPFLA